MGTVGAVFSSSFRCRKRLFEIRFLCSSRSRLTQVGSVLPGMFCESYGSMVGRVRSGSSGCKGVGGACVDNSGGRISVRRGRCFGVRARVRGFVGGRGGLSSFSGRMLRSFLCRLSGNSPRRDAIGGMISVLGGFLPFAATVVGVVGTLTFWHGRGRPSGK